MTLIWRDPGAGNAGASGDQTFKSDRLLSSRQADSNSAVNRASQAREPQQTCLPVALRGHIRRDRGFQTPEAGSSGYVPENDPWFDLLTEPHPFRRDHPNPARNRAGRDPLSIPVDLLTASGHPPRRTAAVMSAYRAGMQYGRNEGPSAKTHKELRAICIE